MFDTPLVAQCSPVAVASEMFCDRCQKVLCEVPAGGTAFASQWCDCSWSCCEHSRTDTQVKGYSCHPAHLAYRPKQPAAV